MGFSGALNQLYCVGIWPHFGTTGQVGGATREPKPLGLQRFRFAIIDHAILFPLPDVGLTGWIGKKISSLFQHRSTQKCPSTNAKTCHCLPSAHASEAEKTWFIPTSPNRIAMPQQKKKNKGRVSTGCFFFSASHSALHSAMYLFGGCLARCLRCFNAL